MNLNGEYKIDAPREKVWAALNDPEVLQRSIAGCEELEKTSDTSFAAKVKAKVGPVSARFKGEVTLSELDPPNGYRIDGEGKGGAAGFAKGGATVELHEDGGGTLLKYQADAKVGGKLAQIGSRLIDGTANKMANDFFGRFAEEVAQLPDLTKAEDEALEAPAEAPEMAAPSAGKGLKPAIWLPLLVLVVALLLWVFAI